MAASGYQGDIPAPATLPQKTEGEREFTEAQIEESQRLMEEQPRIDAALKNYLSFKLERGVPVVLFCF